MAKPNRAQKRKYVARRSDGSKFTQTPREIVKATNRKRNRIARASRKINR